MKKVMIWSFIFIVSIIGIYFSLDNYYKIDNFSNDHFNSDIKPPTDNNLQSNTNDESADISDLETSDIVEPKNDSSIRNDHLLDNKNIKMNIKANLYIYTLVSLFIFGLFTSCIYLIKSNYGRKKVFYNVKYIMRFIIVSLMLTLITFYFLMFFFKQDKPNNNNLPPYINKDVSK